MKEQIARLEQEVRQLLEWMAAKKQQQITLPLDDASKQVIGAVLGQGPGTKDLTQSVDVSTAPTTIDVPAAYAGTVFLLVNGKTIEVPYL